MVYDSLKIQSTFLLVFLFYGLRRVSVLVPKYDEIGLNSIRKMTKTSGKFKLINSSLKRDFIKEKSTLDPQQENHFYVQI